MTHAVFHPATTQLLERLSAELPQSLLLSGEEGVGLFTAATQLAAKQLLAIVRPTDSKGNLDATRGTISVETIRSLYEQTRARYTSRHVVIIDDADRMSHGAQNAFLKLLEEPNEHIHFILTAHQPSRLLPTIVSRVQAVTLLPLTAEQSAAFIAEKGITEAKKQAQLQFIAAGLPAKLSRLIADDDYFAKEAAFMGDARTFIQGSSYEKLLLINKYASNRDETLRLIDAALLILRRSLSGNPEQKLVHQIDRLLEARDAIDANHNIKLQLAQIIV